LFGVAGSVGGAEAVGGGRINMEFEVGGGGAIGGFIIGCGSFTSLAAATVVSLTLAANVCETTAFVVDIEDVGTADLGGALPVDIMIALVYDMVVFVPDDGAVELAVTVVVMISWLGFLSTA
jgi:hypothetical protein